MGIIWGLLTFIILVVCKKIWSALIVPWYEDRVYRDIRLNGNWETEFKKDNEIITETATVYQKANKVSGLIQLQGPTIRQYEFEGQISNLLLTAQYWLKGLSSRDRGAFCVSVKEDGKKLEGYLAWYSDTHDEIRFSTYVWHKK